MATTLFPRASKEPRSGMRVRKKLRIAARSARAEAGTRHARGDRANAGRAPILGTTSSGEEHRRSGQSVPIQSAVRGAVPVLTIRKQAVNPSAKQPICSRARRPRPCERTRDEEANKETVMRYFTALFAALVLSTMSGCASQNTATRGSDTAVRAEARRISNARPSSVKHLVEDPMMSSDRIQHVTGL
jgi:hypothetical protein